MALALCLTLLPAAALAAEPDASETPDAAVADVQAMIDALPDVEALPNMDNDDAMAAYDAVQAAYGAYEALTEAQQAEITGADRFEALFGWFNEQVAPLAGGTEENIYYIYDSVDANGNIIQGTASRTGLIVVNSQTDVTFTGAQFHIVQKDATIHGNLTINSTEGGLIICQGKTLTVEGALIFNGNSKFGIYGQSNRGADAGKLVINNSNGDGAAIRTTSTSTPQLNIYSGEVTINGGKSGKLVEGVKLYSTNKIHAATLDAKKVSPARWSDNTSIEGTSLVLAYCKHEHATYVPEGAAQHKKNCKDCGFIGTAVSCTFDGNGGYAQGGENGHYAKCVCGNAATTATAHDLKTTWTDDGLWHTLMCGICGYIPAGSDKGQHKYDRETGVCTVCQFKPVAIVDKVNADYCYAEVNDALEEAVTHDDPTVTLKTEATDSTDKTIDSHVSFDYDGKSVALAMNGYSLKTSTGGATIAVENGTLTVKGDATLVQNGKLELAAPAVRVTGGTLIFDGNLTATGASGKPAVEVTNGTLRLKAGDVLNGGVSVEGSTTYANVNALLGENLAFAKVGETSAIVKGNVRSITENVTVVAHTHAMKGSECTECGYTCSHKYADGSSAFVNGKCTICNSACAHTNVNNDGVCENCKALMAVKITASDNTVTYGTDFKSAMRNATNGTTVTLLADIELGTTPQDRAAITGDGKFVTLDLNGHTITGGWLDVGGKDTNETYTTCTLKIIGKGSYEPLTYGGIITVDVKATLDLSQWEGGTISAIHISDDPNVEKDNPNVREAAVIVGPKAGTIGKLAFGNNQLDELKKTKLSGGSFNKIEVANFGPVKLGELLAEGYAYQYTDGVDRFVEYTKTLQGESIYNVKVVKCLHPNMKPDATTSVATCEYCGKSGKFVASVDGSLCTDMDEAISYWLANGGTLKLYTDYTAATEKATWTIVSGAHSIDLNGHSMFVQDDGAFKLTNNMHLTGTDGKEIGQITNILLDGSQGGSFTLESGYVGNLVMTGGAVVALKGGSVDTVDVKNCSANTELSIQGGSIKILLNIEDWVEGMHVSATSGSLHAYTLPNGKILADVLDHQYYATGTSLDRQMDTAQPTEKFVIQQAPCDFGSTSKTAKVPINGSIPFTVDSPSGNVGVYDVKWYRRTDSGAKHMTENRVAGVNVDDRLDVFCVITGLNQPNNGTVLWQVAVKGYTIKVVPARLNGDKTEIVITNKDTLVYDGKKLTAGVKVTYNGKELTQGTDYTVSGNTETNAGTYTLTVNGQGNYDGSKKADWTIKPAPLTVDSTGTASGTYGAKLSELTVSGLTAKMGEKTVDGTWSLTGDAVPNVGDNKTYTATFTPSTGAGNYLPLTKDGIALSITKAAAPDSTEQTVTVTNRRTHTYTVDLSALLPKLASPKEYGEVTYALDANTLDSRYYNADTASIENGKLILPIQAVVTETTGNIGTIKVAVNSQNYATIDLTIKVDATNKIIPTGAPTLSKTTLAWGEQLSTITLSGTMTDPTDSTKTVKGKFEWVTPGAAKEKIGEYQAEWKFTPTDTAVYAETSGKVTIKVIKATPKGAPGYTKITTTGKMLKDANLTVGTIQPEGTIQWELGDTTVVTANTAYKWVFTPKDKEHYDVLTGFITPYSVSSNTGGSSSGGGSSSDRDSYDSNPVIKAETKNHTDGSTTKTETKKDGTVIETTTGKDGSTSKTETKKDGSSVTENKAADGSTGTVKTDKNGQTEAKTALSNKAIENAKKNGEAVKAPVEVEAARNSNAAPTVKVELPKNAGKTEVEIPVSNAKPGTVAVLVHPDGTEEILKASVPTENGIRLTVDGSATVKIVDNSKDFIDTRNHWAKDAIDFVSARELVNGMSDSIYAPNNSATRAQLWTILARQNDADLNGGNTWYEKAQLWSKDKGISDGTEPNAAINRAQMVTMLWRAVGQPAAGSAANFTDVPANSYYAQAVAWAVESGITTGIGGGRFDPNSTCTRAQIAAFLARSMK